VGGHPWFYFVRYQSDINRALHELRDREFKAGRYNPVVHFPQFPPESGSSAPGAAHASIDSALAASGENGTRSILDMTRVGQKADYGVVVPLSDERLSELYGTIRPSREMLEQNMEFFEDIERGQGIYLVTYRNGSPSEILFAGYSYD
jgi:hypothetical protein